jgi:nucleoside-diphosphate-sugar epimerase
MISIPEEAVKRWLNEEQLEEFADKSILVTGASGVIGKHLIAGLCELNSAHGLNMKILGWSKSGSFLGIEHYLDQFEQITGDICDYKNHANVQEVDLTIHGSGYGQPQKFMQDPATTIKINTDITHHLLKKTRERFLFCSSSEVYSGLDTQSPTETEVGTTNSDHPRAPYIESKKMGEVITLQLSPNNVIGTVARIALAYGPGGNLSDSRVLNELIMRGINNGSVNLMDAGESIRTYCYVEDSVRMLLNLLASGKREIYNVGGESVLSIAELGELVSLQLGVPFTKVDSMLGQNGAPAVVTLSIEKTKEICGDFEFINIDSGVRKTINWYQALIQDCS